MAEPAAVVRAHLDAFTAGDLDRLLATLGPAASFMTGTTVVDPSDFPEFFGWAMREIAPAIRIVSLVADGGQVACQFVESVTVDGARQRLRRAAFYLVSEGLITSVKVYDEGP